jgi:two-component system, OmpR family, phosphate regulon sensor histidine kinase PhoR
MRLRANEKLFLSYLAVIATVVAVLTVGVGGLLRRHMTELLADDVRRELALAEALYDAGAPGDPDSLAVRLGALSGRRVTIIARDGTVVGDSEVERSDLGRLENHGGRPEVSQAFAGGAGEAVRRSASVNEEQLYLAIRTADGRILRMAVPLNEVRATVARVRRGIYGFGAVALAVTAVLSLGFSLAVTRPLRELAGVARAMAAGDLERRTGVRGRDEVGELAEALDTLAGELRRRLAQLEGERHEMQVLIDSMAEAVIAVDREGRVSRANPAARAIFSLGADPRGIAPEEVARRQAFLEVVRRVMGGSPVLPTELSQDGRTLLATAQPLAGGGAVMVFLDVSELRRLEDVRRDFVANASHELKTPLTAIRGFAETLMDPELPEPLRAGFTRTVHDNAERLQRIIDDLLDLSRIESGGWRVEPEVVSIADEVAGVWSALAGAATERGARLEVAVPEASAWVEADPSALRQILTNLIGNALRYLAPGGTVGVAARDAGDGWVEVAVSDDGAGIPSAHLPRIFERFYRVDAARSREEGGTGLGLAIVKHLVEAHGGTVDAESELGAGTTVRFRLPAASAEATDPSRSDDDVTAS